MPPSIDAITPITTYGDPHVVTSTDAAYRWPQHGLSKVVGGPKAVVPLIRNRELSTSGAFYGIGASEVSDLIQTHVHNECIKERCSNAQGHSPTPPKFENVSAMEKDGTC
eukprot:2584805-Pyramimonas_sp.AAC.1